MLYKIKDGIDINSVSNFDTDHDTHFDIESAHIWEHNLYDQRPSVCVRNGRSVPDELGSIDFWIHMDALELYIDYLEFFNDL